ncbi:MAG TPA: BON domain-containing protein [Gemmatimonadaceae bacterium]|nr:BON domain-containing protein [Gemmatimonadaceae bacterium]
MAYDEERGGSGRGEWDYPGEGAAPRRAGRPERAERSAPAGGDYRDAYYGEGGWPGRRGPGDRGLTGDLGYESGLGYGGGGSASLYRGESSWGGQAGYGGSTTHGAYDGGFYGRPEDRPGGWAPPTGAPRNPADQGYGSGGFGDTAPYGSWPGAGYGGRAPWGDRPPAPKGPSYAGRGPKNYRRSDERIHEEVCEALTRHPGLDASDLEVRVADGEVTLSGTVTDRRAKRLAEDLAEDCAGVRDVRNELRLGERRE